MTWSPPTDARSTASSTALSTSSPPTRSTSAQFTKALGRAVGRPTVFPLPGFAVRALFGERGEAVLLEGQRALPTRLLDAGHAFSYPELDRALERAMVH